MAQHRECMLKGDIFQMEAVSGGTGKTFPNMQNVLMMMNWYYICLRNFKYINLPACSYAPGEIFLSIAKVL